jgi:hypothetical protein
MIRPSQLRKLVQGAALLSSFAITACSFDADKLIRPTSTRPAPATFARIKANAPAEMLPAIEEREAKIGAARRLLREALNDARRNSTRRFGAKGKRSLASVCKGVEQLLTEYLPRVDSAAGFARPESAIRGRVAEAMSATRCRTIRVASIARPVYVNLALTAAAPLTSEEDSLWVAENITEALPNAIDLYGNYAPSSHSSFTGGLNEYEAAFFEGAACEVDANQYTYESMAGPGGGGDEGGGEDEMSISGFAGCGRAAAVGCGAGVLLGWRGIVESVGIGLEWGGPWGGVAAGVGATVVTCGVGALTGYLICHYAT